RDPTVVALGIFGSVVEGRSWDRSDVDLWLVLDEDSDRHEAAAFLEQGAEVSLQIASRSNLRRLVERSRGSPMCRALATTRWLWCRDAGTELLLERVRSFPEPWRGLRTLEAVDQIRARLDEAEKMLFLGEPLGAVPKLADAFVHLARARLIGRGIYPGRDPVGQVIGSEPQLIQGLQDLTDGVLPVDERIEQAVEYLDGATEPLAGPCLEALRPVLAAGPRSASQLEDDPAFERLDLEWVALLGWLVRLGLLQQGMRSYPAGQLFAGLPEIVYALPS
ncbi:MAG: hypothetical protein ACM3ZA_11190, partial [Bacillota bacterium]